MMKLAILVPIIIAAIVTVVVVGLLVSQTRTPESEMLIERAIANLFDVETFKYQGGLSLIVEGMEKEASEQELLGTGSLLVEFSGLVDASEETNIKGSADIDIGFFAQDTDLSIAAKIKNIGKDVYIKISSLPDLLAAFLDQEFIEALENQWLKVGSEQLEEISGQYQIIQDIKLLLADRKFFNIEDDFGDNHYLVSIDKQALKQIMPEYLELAKKYVPVEQLAEYEAEMEQALENLPAAIDDIWLETGGINFEAWTDNKPRLERIKFERKITNQELGDLGVSGAKEVSMKLDLQFSDFNKSVEIEAPTEYMNLEELIAPLLMQVDSSLAPEYNLPEE